MEIGLNSSNLTPLQPNIPLQENISIETQPQPQAVQTGEVNSEVIIQDDHSFQVVTEGNPEIQMDQMDTPQKPMPLLDTELEHNAEIQEDRLGLGECPEETRQVLEKMADDLGEHGVTLMKTLAQTHAFQARLQGSDEPLTQEEIEKLENAASDLHQELKEGLITPEALLTRANAKIFKLTSVDEMKDLLMKTNNKVRDLAATSGFSDLFEAVDKKLSETIQKNELALYQLLKTSTKIPHPSKDILPSATLNPKEFSHAEFDRSAFLSEVAKANGPDYGEYYGDRERILDTAWELFNARQAQVNLRTADSELHHVRNQILGLDGENTFDISPENKADEAMKIADKNIKQLEKISRHPDKKLNEAHREALTKFFTELNAGRTAAHIKMQNCGPEQAEDFLNQFQTSLGYHAQTIRTVRKQLRFAQFQPSREQLIEKQIKAITPLWEKGGTKTVSGNIGLGIPGSVMGVPLTGTMALSYSYTIDCSNQKGAITDANVKGLTVGLKIGSKKVCSVQVTASTLVTHARIFKNPREFVEHTTNNMLTAILMKRSFLFQSIQNRRYEKDKWIAMTNNNLLLNRLNVMGAVDTGDKVSNADLKSTKSIYTEMKTHTKMLKSDLKALEGAVSNVASVSKAKSTMTINSDIFDMLKKDPRLYAKQKESYYLNRAHPDKSKMKPLELMAHQEKVIQKATEERNLERLERYNKILYLTLEDLNTEFKTYASVVNAYEMKTANAPDVNKKIRHFLRIKNDESQTGRLLNLKMNFDKSRGASNRGEYLRAIMFTHARLTEVYNKSVEGIKQLTREDIPLTHGTTLSKLQLQQQAIDGFKDEYLNPPMHMNHKRHVQRFMTIKKNSQIITNTQDSVTNVIIPGKVPIGIEVKTTRKDVTKHHMRSQQVETKTFEFGLNSGTLKHFTGIMTALAGHCNDGTLPSALIKGGISDAVKIISTGKEFGGGSDAFTHTKNAAFKVQVNCIMDKDNNMHFNNCTLLSASAGNASVTAGPVSVGGGVNESNILGQFMGNKTLNYPFNRYFFTKDADGNPPDNWDKFLDTNIKNARKLFYNALTPGTLAYQELTSYNDDGEVPNCMEDVQQFIKEYTRTRRNKNNPEEKPRIVFKKLNDEKLKTAFTDLMKLIAKFEGQVSLQRLEAQN